MKVLIYLLPVLFLVACSNSSDSKSGVPSKGKSDKLTEEISKEMTSFTSSFNDFGSIVAESISGDNTVGPRAPDEIKLNCHLVTSKNMSANGISSDAVQLSGDNCPLEVDKQYRYPQVQGDLTWTNTYLVKSAAYQEKFGFTKVIEKNEVHTDNSSKTYSFLQEVSIYQTNGGIAVWTLSVSGGRTEQKDTYSNTSSLQLNGDTVKSQLSVVNKVKPDGGGIENESSDHKFYFNDKEITAEEYEKTNAGQMLYFY